MHINIVNDPRLMLCTQKEDVSRYNWYVWSQSCVSHVLNVQPQDISELTLE